MQRRELASRPYRRTFLVGMAAAGLVCGFGARQGGARAASAANFAPSPGTRSARTAWSPSRRQGRHGPAHRHDHGADRRRGARRLWSDMRVDLAGNDPKYNDPVLGATITGGTWSTMMNFDTMCRAGAAGRIALIEAGAAMLGRARAECIAHESRVIHPRAASRFPLPTSSSRRQGDQDLHRRRAQGDQAEDARPVYADRQDRAAARHSRQDQRRDQIRHRHDAAGHGLRPPVTPPVRYGAKVKSFDDSEAKKVTGFIKAVVVDDPTKTITGWVVVVAETYAEAITAADAAQNRLRQGPERQRLRANRSSPRRKRLQAIRRPARSSSRTATRRRR